MAESKPIKILFVCTGDTCRSVLAEYLLKKSASDNSLAVASAGIAANPNFPIPGAIGKLLAQEGVADFDHTPTLLDAKKVEWADYIFVMEQVHKQFIDNKYPQAKAKTHLLKEFAGVEAGKTSKNDPAGGEITFDVADPIGSPDEVYRKCLKEIKESLAGILGNIEKKAGH